MHLSEVLWQWPWAVADDAAGPNESVPSDTRQPAQGESRGPPDVASDVEPLQSPEQQVA